MNYSPLRNICYPRKGRRMRSSSYDRTGGNEDYIRIKPNEAKVIMEEDRPGCITHIWMTGAPLINMFKTEHLPRKVVIRMFWDNEETPSVEVPLGDFFGIGHGVVKNFVSLPFQMSPQDGAAFNCWLPMPFESGARIEIENQSEIEIKIYYYVDYEQYDASDTPLRFHACFRREITVGIDESKVSTAFFHHGGVNLTGEGNYVILDAKGQGHYIGCNINIHNLRFTQDWNWYGEGDDMIFIDDELWPPRLHGTGMEDYFNTAWCPRQEYNAPYHGITMAGDANWGGRVSYYRFHIEDPIMFEKSIKVTIEHGHANHRSDDYSSTAYWYQTEPHAPGNELMPVDLRLPLPTWPPMDRKELIQYFHLEDLFPEEFPEKKEEK